MGEEEAWSVVLAPSTLERFVKILAIDTAEWSTSVALWEDGQALAFQEKRPSLLV